MTTPASRHLPPDIHRTAVNGCDVRYLRAGSGTPVVFVHTLRTQLEMFLQVIEQLDTTQVEVIAIDLPGHGESTAHRSTTRPVTSPTPSKACSRTWTFTRPCSSASRSAP